MSLLPNRIWQQKFNLGLTVLLLSVSAVGCSDQSTEFTGVAVGLSNYTDQDVYLTVKSPERTDVDTYVEMGKRAGGGASVCCVALPERWRPGLQVRVDYKYGNPPARRTHSKIIELPPYPDGVVGPLFISVLSEEEVEVISSIYGPGAEKWPGKMKQLP